jgi:phage portal protein BeeE
VKLLSRLTGSAKSGLTINTVEVLEDGSSFYTSSYSSTSQEISDDFGGYIASIYKRNGPVFACIQARALPFSEVRFQFQKFNSGRPGDLFGTPSLSLLERPWPNGTTGELLYRMEQDVSLAGNFYATTVGTGANRRIRRLRPDWVTIVSGLRDDATASPYELNSDVLGYIYSPPAPAKPTLLSPDRVVHFSPLPDPDAQWRGMSWITAVISEVQADIATTRHKQKFFENGASLSLAVKYDAGLTPQQVREWATLLNEAHRGTENAYKTLHLGGGADPVPIGISPKDLDFKAIQGASETRIASASGVGAIIARFSEGLGGSSLNEGNYNSAKRQFVDMLLRPHWRMAAAALEKFADPVPGGARLWYDARDVALLSENEKDAADILASRAATLRQLVDAGYTPESAVSAVQNDDLSLLVHSGLYSVQLQEPGHPVERITESVALDKPPPIANGAQP